MQTKQFWRVTAAAAAMACLLAGCGSRLTGGALRLAEGAGARSSAASSAAQSSGASSSARADSGGAAGSAVSAGSSSANTATSGATAAGSAGTGCQGQSAGATDVGVTGQEIHIGNIASITGVAPGLTESAQQATEAVAAYLNSQGGICGRKVVVDAYDDGNSSSGNYTAARQACAGDFALVGGASGFDDGGASAVSACGIPDIPGEVSTQAATDTADVFGANPGELTYWPQGPAVWLRSTYPSAVAHAAMVYLNVPATIEQAQDQMRVYQSQGFTYVYSTSVSPTEPNYAPYVQKMQSAGVQYVTEWSDDNSAARLALAMQQADFHPQVVDWIPEMYSPGFLQETQGDAVGDLVLLTSAPYEDANAIPGMAVFETWMNRVAPGWTHDIFAEFAWSAGLLFARAAVATGPHLTRAGLLSQLRAIGTWTGGGVAPPVTNLGQKVPSPCFTYFRITASGFARVYPSAPGTYDCNGGLFKL